MGRPLKVVKAARPKPLSGAGTSLYSGVVSAVDPNTALEGSAWYGDVSTTGIAHEMERDAHVRASVSGIVDPLLGGDWAAKPHSKDPFALEVADFIAWNLFELIDWKQCLRDSLYYIRDGSAVLELTDDVCPVSKDRFPNHLGRGTGIAMTGVHGVQRRTIREWIQSENNTRKIDGIVQHLHGSDAEAGGMIPISSERLLRFTWEQEGANFDGHAPQRCAYAPWKVKRMYTLTGAIQAEREGAGIPVITLPEGATDDDKDAADQILMGLASSHKGRMVLPNGYEFKFEAPHGSPVVFEERIAKCNFDIAHGISRMGFMLLGTASGQGSYALASEQRGQYSLGLERHAAFIEGIWNHGSDELLKPIHRLVELNYGEKGLRALPKLTSSLPTQDWSVVWPIIKDLVVAGVMTMDDTLEHFARQSLMLPPAEVAELRAAAPVDGEAAPAVRGASDGKTDKEAFEKSALVINALAGTGLLRSDDKMELYLRDGMNLPDVDEATVRDPRTSRGVETADILKVKGQLDDKGAAAEEPPEVE